MARVLVVGRDITRSCELKFARGERHLRGLLADLAAWQDAGHVRPGLAVSPNRDEVQVGIHSVAEQPPLEEWALVLGEGLHAYRSGLDILAGELCRLDGATPPKPTRIYFPIAETRKDWRSAISALPIPAEILERIEWMQPYHPADKSESMLLAMHRLDIRDKHNGLIEAAAHVGDVQTALVAGFDAGTVIEMQPWSDPVPLVDGHPVMRYVFSKPMLPGTEPTMSSYIDVSFTVVLGDLRIPLVHLCETVIAGMPGLLSLILDGEAPAGWTSTPTPSTQDRDPSNTFTLPLA